jgi:CBS domain containing-hemolysin-like protein
MRDVLAARARAGGPRTAGELAQPAVTLAADTPIQRAVAALQERRASLALVRAADGRLLGLVGLDDLLASVLGSRVA